MRLDRVVYTEVGITSGPARRFSTALEASCDDLGPNSSGTSFGSRSRDVPVWSFAGFDTRQVLGVRLGDEFRVLTARSLDRRASSKLLEEISTP